VKFLSEFFDGPIMFYYLEHSSIEIFIYFIIRLSHVDEDNHDDENNQCKIIRRDVS